MRIGLLVAALLVVAVAPSACGHASGSSDDAGSAGDTSSGGSSSGTSSSSSGANGSSSSSSSGGGVADGGSDAALSADEACWNADDGSATGTATCNACCKTANATGWNDFNGYVQECACGGEFDGPCASVCSGSDAGNFCDDGGSPTGACTTCLGDAVGPGGACSYLTGSVSDACAADPSCTDYLNCGTGCI